MKKVLIVLSSANELPLQDGKPHATGFFLGELYEPLEKLIAAGVEFDVATPDGTEAAIDSDSLRNELYWKTPKMRRMKEEALALVQNDERFKKPKKLAEIDPSQFDALFVPGGHAPMVDLAKSEEMANLLNAFNDAEKPIGLICHAPTVLLSLPKEKFPFEGYKMTVFSDCEEKLAEKLFLKGKVPYYPETELKARGAVVKKAKLPWFSYVQRDRNLLTGQNPSSADAFGREFVEMLAN